MKAEEKRKSLISWLFNPFLFWGGEKLFLAGVLAMLLHIPMAIVFNIRFGGVLDMHVGPEAPALAVIATDILIAWVVMFLFLYASIRLFGKTARLIDIAGAVGVARLPLVFTSIPVYFTMPEIETPEEVLALQGSEMGWLIAGALLSLPFFAWFIVLLFNAFKVNSNQKGWKLGVGFAGAVILAEVASLFLNRYFTGLLP
jgi:hypothetical protein